MAFDASKTLGMALGADIDEVVAKWLRIQIERGATRDGRISEAELRSQGHAFAMALADAGRSGSDDFRTASFAAVREHLEIISRARAALGFTPGETALFIFSLKQPLFDRVREVFADNSDGFADAMWTVSRLIDDLGLFTVELAQRSREELIERQNQEIAELSTPVVTLWDGILALPLIGTLDSARTQVVMENLLQAIVDQQAQIAIIDITGVPTVDTLVAQHLIKTVSAARLMGADCLISGIRPQIAQTMVHLGVELNVTTKATLAGAFRIALQRTGQTVAKVRSETGSQGRA